MSTTKKRRPDGTKEAPFTYRLSPAEEHNDPTDVREDVRDTYRRGYVRIVRRRAGSPLVEIMEDPGWKPPPKPAKTAPKPREIPDTVEGYAREAQNCLEAAPTHFVSDPDDALRLLDEASAWIERARIVCRRAPR